MLLCFVLSLLGSMAGRAEESISDEDGQNADHAEDPKKHGVGLDENPVALVGDEGLPAQPGLLVEWGPDYLSTGELPKGFKLPTGAVWTPSLWVWGQLRGAVSYVDAEQEEELLEIPLRLDLFASLQLSVTERLVVGISPLHQEGRFSTYTFLPDEDSGWQGEGNYDLTTIFFEGDVAEIFPTLDVEKRRRRNFAFAVGRQALSLQDGIFFNDIVDSVGIVRHNMFTIPGASGLRVTGLYGWGDIHRGDGNLDRDATLWMLTSETDRGPSTWEVDLAYVNSEAIAESGGDGLYWGVGRTRRYGRVNTTFRALGSYAIDEESAAVGDGHIVFAEISTSPRGTHDVLYIDAFWGIDRFTSVARDPTTGGPVGRTGLLFAAVGLGKWRPALSNDAEDAFGTAIGYQRFWNGEKTQLVLELGGRDSTTDGPGSVAAGARFEQKLGNRYMLRLDSYVSGEEARRSRWGFRSELLISF